MTQCPGCQAEIEPRDAMCRACGRFLVNDPAVRAGKPKYDSAGFAIALFIGIMVLSAGTAVGAALLAMPRMEKKNEQSHVFSLQSQAQSWSNHHEGACPTLFDIGESNDAWGTPYRIVCDGRVHVSSNGPDRLPDTSDDIRSP